jgi:hypothetical protein
MRAIARNSLTYVKRDPWYAYEPLWNSVRFAGHQAAVQLNFPGLERESRIEARFTRLGPLCRIC